MPSTLLQRVALGLPPMYAWPRPAKYAVMGAGLAVCLAAYGAGLLGLCGLAATFLQAP